MCGGYSLISSKNTIRKRFKADLPASLPIPNYNARPGQHLPIIIEKSGIKIAYWGYKPHWTIGKAAKSVINARAETISKNRYFSDSFKTRRCLIPADGFYEWKKTTRGKQPYRIFLKDENPFAFAGIWDEGTDREGEIMPVFAIITVDANKEMAAIHDRMPVILPSGLETSWLSSATKTIDAFLMLKPYPEGLLKTCPVSKLVNSPENNGPEILVSKK